MPPCGLRRRFALAQVDSTVYIGSHPGARQPLDTWMTPTRSEIIAAIQTYAHEIAEREFPPFAEALVIAELGMDSLSTLEMVGMLEREMGIYLPTEELGDIHTVGQLTDVVLQKLAARNGVR
jgi:acyl carrier protein